MERGVRRLSASPVCARLVWAKNMDDNPITRLARRVFHWNHRYDWYQYKGYYLVETYRFNSKSSKWELQHMKSYRGNAPTEPRPSKRAYRRVVA